MEQIVVYASSPSPCDLASDYTMAARTLPRVLACMLIEAARGLTKLARAGSPPPARRAPATPHVFLPRGHCAACTRPRPPSASCKVAGPLALLQALEESTPVALLL